MKEVDHWKYLYFSLTGDHFTPCSLAEHSSDPLPVFLTGAGVPVDGVVTYGERFCSKGELGRIRCQDFFAMLFSCLRGWD